MDFLTYCLVEMNSLLVVSSVWKLITCDKFVNTSPRYNVILYYSDSGPFNLLSIKGCSLFYISALNKLSNNMQCVSYLYHK